jgi:PTH1 family peptidyl-tRNA hydrolase
MKLVVGLGNPGPQYAGTRHNVGFEVVDALAVRLGWAGSPGEFSRLARSKFDGLALDGSTSSGEKLLLLTPMTFMNGSGRSVQSAVGFFQLDASKDVLVVLDDVALPCGRIRLRASGSSGGHNGLKDIERALATDAYARLRVGIDAPPPRVPQRDYVLGRFSPDQRDKLEPAIARSCAAIETWIDKGMTAAMNQFNAAEDDKQAT